MRRNARTTRGESDYALGSEGFHKGCATRVGNGSEAERTEESAAVAAEGEGPTANIAARRRPGSTTGETATSNLTAGCRADASSCEITTAPSAEER